MKKTMIYILLALLVIIVVMVMIGLSNPLRKPQEEIRANILELTPIGTNMDDVLKVIKSKNWETMYVSYDYGVPQEELGRSGTSIGEKAIRAIVGGYYFGSKFDLYTFIKKTVTVSWSFDADSKLIEVYVMKFAAGF